MSVHWKSVLPVDRYIVRVNGLLHDYDRKVLTRLYQPLMGVAAYSLYMTLWSETDEDRFWGKPSTHHSLMTVTQMNLQQIFDQRRKLEALSLLKTFVNDGKETRTFLYQLEPPLAPSEFFRDDVLSVYLYNRIGKQRFNELKGQFSFPSVDTTQYQEVTASFDDAFRSVHHSELMPTAEIQKEKQLDNRCEWVGRHPSDGIQVKGDRFDFGLLMMHLSDFIVPKESITDELKEAIMKLAFLYRIEPLEMSRLVEFAAESDGTVKIDRLREKVRDWYLMENNDQLPQLTDHVQPLKYRTVTHPTNEEEKLIYALETQSPAERLEEIGGGKKPVSVDLKLIEDIMLKQGLEPGVINVLIDYVMIVNDMKLTRNYVERIAGQWMRKGIKTVEEAMSLARSEHEKYKSWAPQRRQRKTGTSKNEVRKEPLPKWMTEKEEEPSDENWEAKRKQLEERFKKYRKNDLRG